ncbi:MAG: universal stress protein [Caldilineaceae bacterium]|nr:universal stress protein [Caldilineaceae bacterium]
MTAMEKRAGSESTSPASGPEDAPEEVTEEVTGEVTGEVTVTTQRVLVALDRSPHSYAALRAAAQLAATLRAELHGLYVEDAQLLRLCNSPFSREVSVLTATVRPLRSVEIERKLQVMAAELRRQLAYAAAEAQVQWSFHVRRGGVEQELLAEAENALLLGLGRTNQFARRGVGSTARRLARMGSRPLLLLGQREDFRGPLTLVYTGSAGAKRALTLTAQLAQQSTQPLTILLVADAEQAETMHSEVAEQLQSFTVPPNLVTIDAAEDQTSIIKNITGALVLPGDYVELLAEVEGPVLLVP